jgi:hypothetical protein
LILCCGEALIDFVPLEGGGGYQYTRAANGE